MKKIILMLALCLPILLQAQNSGVYVTNIKLQNKAEKWCWSICQDTQGNMLFGTERGVMVFDGTNQELIKTPATPLALLCDTKSERIWMSGSETIGVLEREGTHYTYKPLLSRTDNDFNQLFLLADTLYCISDSLIIRYHAQSLDKIDEYSTGDLLIDEAIAYKGKIYFVIDYFLHIIEDGTLLELTDSDFPVDEFSYGVSIDSTTIILGTSTNNTFAFNGKNYSSFKLSSPFFENNRVTNGYYYNDSLIILSSLAGGIALFDYTKKKITKQISYFNGLPDDEIRCAFIDRQQGIWLSHAFGISRVELNLGIENYSYYPGLKGNPIAINYFDNNLYVATNDGLFILDEIKDYNEFDVKVQTPVIVREEIPVAAQESQIESEDDEKQGFFLFRSKKKRSKQSEEDEVAEQKSSAKTKTRQKVVHQTKTVRKRSLKSINHYFKQVDGMNGKYTQMVPFNNFLVVAGNNGLYAIKNKKSETILKDTYIVYIYTNPAANEIYCCTNNGLYKIYRDGNRWVIDHFAQTTSALIKSVAREADGNWVLAYDKMLIRAKLKYKKVNVIHEIQLPEIPGQTFILKNINDSLLVFTSDKIYHFNKEGQLNIVKELSIDNYIIQNQNNYTWLFNKGSWTLYADKKYTLPTSHVNRLNLFGNLRYIDYTEDKELWLVDDKYQLYKLLEATDAWKDDFNISLRELLSNNQQFNPTEKVKLSSSHNNVTAKFNAPFYLMQQGVSFRYYIEGLSKEWSDWSPYPEVNIGYLPPGNFTLQYEAMNALGNISNAARIEIQVPKPFTQTLWFFILLLLAFVGIAYLVFKIRLEKLKKDKEVLEQKVKERTATIQEQKSEIEKQHDEITSSIRYAKRIQTAMLPHDEIIEAMLPHHFILFNPRDIVSGDFYFFKPVGNKIVFVAADCTGHGVPGGFMSMLGISFLSEITSRLTSPSASEILDHLRDKIKLTLGQDDVDSTQKDGMDIAVCVIDTQKKQLQFSGAFNPLFIIRDEQLDVVKADRQPVAVYIKESIFTNHIIDVQENDCFYMFSDGFPDQIGGPRQRKFMTKNFKNMLLENHKRSMSEQKEILQKSLNEWKGDSMQVDDILVVGFKL